MNISRKERTILRKQMHGELALLGIGRLEAEGPGALLLSSLGVMIKPLLFSAPKWIFWRVFFFCTWWIPIIGVSKYLDDSKIDFTLLLSVGIFTYVAFEQMKFRGKLKVKFFRELEGIRIKYERLWLRDGTQVK